MFLGGPASTTPGYTPAEGTLPVGAECNGYDGCVPGAECKELGADARAVCTRACTAGSCPEGSRCTETPEGSLCLARCEKHDDCGAFSPLLCVDTGHGEAVCYPDGATSGEVVPKVALAVVRVAIRGPSNSPGLEPGRTATLEVEVANVGSRKLMDLTGTLEKTTALITNVEGAASGPHYLSLDGRATVTNAQLTVDPTAPDGAPLTLVLHLRDGEAGAVLDLPIDLRVEARLAHLVTSRVEATVSGDPAASLAEGVATRVEVYARNVGLTSTAEAAVTATVTGPATGQLEAASLSYVSPLGEALVAEGTLTRTGAGLVQAKLQYSGANLPATTDTLDL